MFWTKEKLEARIKELDGYRYRDATSLASIRMQIDPMGEIGVYPSLEGDWEDVKLGDHWSGRDYYVWLSMEVQIPAAWHGRKVVGQFDFGQSGGGNNSGFESLLFVNGKPYQGVDSNHKEVFFTSELIGTNVSLQFRLWSGLNGYAPAAPIEHTMRQASIGWLDEATDDLFYTARAALDTVQVLSVSSPDYHDLLKALDRSFHRIDWSYPGSETFYGSILEARDTLQRDLGQMPKRDSISVQCIGHTHIDVAWLWRLKHTREKAARSFSTVLRLMEQYPDYVFLQTQPQLYEYIKTDYPEIYEQIRARVKEGRWEAGGAMWLEADCNLTSGESLVRQLLYGMRFFKEEFGVDCTYLWLPDVFGYSWALPQILKKFGIDTFMTTKISWNQYNRMPHDTFQWRGIDGSEVLTHFITTPDPGADEGAFYYTYNGKVTPQSVQGIWDAYRNKEINQSLLLSYGYGDGGGGVNREMLEMRRRLEKMPGVPKVTTGRADDYFKQLKETIQETDQYVHTWDGELYLELHRGTYTSQAYNKRANRKLELLYRETEWLSAMNSIIRNDWAEYGHSELVEGWKIIMRNQFHDIIPGSSIGEVYEDCRLEYAEAFEIANRVWNRSADALAQSVREVEDKNSYLVFNSANWSRDAIVAVTDKQLPSCGYWVDHNGVKLVSVHTGDQWLVQVKQIPSMGYAVMYYSNAIAGEDQLADDPNFIYDTKGISTPFYRIEWNDAGQLTSVYDKTMDREVLAKGEAGNVLQVFEDKPKGRHEAWDIDLFYQQKMRTIGDLQFARLIESGPLRAVVEFQWLYGQSTITQRMLVYADNRRIDFDTKVDWQERRQLLKAAFPVNIRSTEATFDIQFGNVKRPTHWNTSWDYARYETVGQQWADLSERGYGVSLLNDCKYGYDIKDHLMRLTLIKSAMVPDPMADLGEHVFTYALFPHQGDWLEGGTVPSAWELNNPIQAASGSAQAGEMMSLFQTKGGHVLVDAIKKAEDQDKLIVRLHEYAGARNEIIIESSMKILSWQECDLMERPLEEPKLDGELRFSITPYEIKTFIIEIAF
ncbi:alpha-mannosidase [Paenibacillus sp. strain BS8-2]